MMHWLAADPAKLVATARAGHVITMAVLRDRCATRSALGDEQVP